MLRRERRGWFGGREETGDAVAERVVMGGMMVVRGKAGERLATGAGGFIEAGTVNGRDYEVVGAVKVEGGWGTKGEGEELGLG